MVKRNVIANVLGGTWTAGVTVVLIPVQIHFLGVAAYGLIAFVAAVQVLFSIFDFGLSPTITRELAKDSSPGQQHTYALLRLITPGYALIGALLGAAMYAGAGWLAGHWLQLGGLPADRAVAAIHLAAIAIAMRWPVSFLSGVLAGRQRFDALNIVRASAATINGAGTVAVLMTTGDLVAYMAWTVVAAVIEVVAYLAVVTNVLPGAVMRRAAGPIEGSVWAFARGMTAVNLLTMILTQSDRLLISKLLSLQVLGYYALAYNVLYGLTLIQNFVTSALFPAFVTSVSRVAPAELRDRYSKATQLLMYAYNLPIWLLVFFGRDVLALATPGSVADRAAPILAVLAGGFLLNAAASLAYTAAVAGGNTQLPIRTNVVAVLFYVPVLSILTIRFGAMGAAVAWIVLNAYYVPTLVRIVHREILDLPILRWLTSHVLTFVGVGAVAFGAAKVVSNVVGGDAVHAIAFAAIAAVGYAIAGFALLNADLRIELISSARRGRIVAPAGVVSPK